MEIIKLENNNGKLITTSLEIAKVTERLHKNVMQEIREELNWSAENISPHNLNEYKDKQGKLRRYYVLDEYETLQVMSKYSKDVRVMVINEFKRMKEYIKAQDQKYSTKDILKLATAEIERLETELIETTARKEEVTQVLTTIQTYGDNVLFRDFVKTVWQENKIEITEKEFRNILKKEKYIMSNNMPYANHIRFFNVNRGVKNGKAWSTTRLSARGQLYFTNKLIKMFEVQNA